MTQVSERSGRSERPMSGLLTTDIVWAGGLKTSRNKRERQSDGKISQYARRQNEWWRDIERDTHFELRKWRKGGDLHQQEGSMMRVRNEVESMLLIWVDKEEVQKWKKTENDERKIKIFFRKIQEISGSYEYKNARFDF